MVSADSPTGTPRSGARIAAALAGLLATGAIASASALASPPMLEGETFGGPSSVFSVISFPAPSCDLDGSATFGYSAYGPASGPYPGDFQAHGTVTLGARPGGPLSRAPVTSFSSDFFINSGATSIAGTASLGDGTDMLGFATVLGGFDF